MQQENKIEHLRQALLKNLQESNIDISRVVELTSELTRLDPNYVRFSVDADHISHLGKELVAKQETAVSELVKNAYDADATVVELTFEQTNLPGGQLQIDDNGIGMNRTQLINDFMRLSSTNKIRHPISPWYKRQRAGRKGIGRFAVQRLGHKVTIITQTKESEEALSIEINWKEFEQERELGSIASRVDQIKKTKEHGTTLIIEGLAEAWTDSSITRVYRYIADLIQPFPLSKIPHTSQIDPGFHTKMYRMSNGKQEEVASVEKMIYEHALAEVDAYVDHLGHGFWSIKSTHFGINEENLEIGKEREQAKSPFTYLKACPDAGKNIRLKAYYYIYGSKYIPRTQNKLIRELAKERGGIRIYRNGFRVLPYGESSDDWLRLDADRANDKNFVPYANKNFLGFVELIDKEGKLFEETSSREGLIENEAFKELADFVSRVLRAVARKMGEARELTKSEAQKGSGKGEVTPTERIKAATQELSQIAERLESGLDSPATENTPNPLYVREIIRKIEEATVKQEEESKAKLEEMTMLRVLGSLGLTIGEFTHEINNLLPAIQADTNQLLRIHPQKTKPRQYALRLQQNLKSFNTYASFFDRAISSNARREMKIQSLRVVIDSFIEASEPTANRYNIKILKPKIRGYDLFPVPMHPSEWNSILFNLFTNSKKAVHRARTQGEILISAGRKGQHVYLQFADNGDGIAPENKARIFDAFFTTSSPASPLANEEEQLLGSGLGLKIIKDIVSSYNGDITLVTPPSGFSTCFRIELPRATDKELRKYGY